MTLMEELEEFNSIKEAAKSIDGTLTEEERSWVSRVGYNGTVWSILRAGLYEVYEEFNKENPCNIYDLGEIKPLSYFSGHYNLNVAKMLANPRVRLVLYAFTLPTFSYRQSLNLSLIPELPSKLLLNWDSFEEVIENYPKTSSSFIKMRSEMQDPLTLNLINHILDLAKIINWDTQKGMLLSFINDENKALSDRLRVTAKIKSIPWEGHSPSEFDKIFLNLLEETRRTYNLEGIPNSLVLEMFK